MAPPRSRKISIMGFRSVGFEKKIKHKGQEYQLDLVDTAGQDEYSIIPQSQCFGNHGYVLVYFVTSRKSFEVVQEIRTRLLHLIGSSRLPILLVGNETDLHMERVISSEEGASLAQKWKAAFLESTAKENKTVQLVFHSIIDEIERLQSVTEAKKRGCLVS